jgi:ABC transporter DrrB family efflux protein
VLRGLRAVAAKEIIHVRRDPAALAISVLLPIVQLTIFGYALDTDVKHIRTAVYDLDHRPASRQFVHRMEATQYYSVVEYVNSDGALRDSIVAGRAKVGVKIPPDYSEKLLRGETAQILVLVDGSDSQIAFKAQTTAVFLATNMALEKLSARGSVTMPVDVRPRVLFNPDMKSANFFVPGLVGLIMQIVTTMLTALSIVREKEQGTLEQLLVTPVDKLALMLGKLAPYAALGLFQTALVVFLMWSVFGVGINGSLLLLAALAPIFLFAGLGLGLMISTFARTQAQAFQASFLIILPSVLLSGFVFPRESMPALIYPLTTIIPVTYFLEILRGIILRGAGWPELWRPAMILLLLGTGIMTIAVARFQKRLG